MCVCALVLWISAEQSVRRTSSYSLTECVPVQCSCSSVSYSQIGFGGRERLRRTHDFIYIYIYRQETCDLRWCLVFWFLNTWRWASNQSCDRFYRYPDYCAQMNDFFFFLQFSFYIFSIETDHIARYGKMSERAARQKFWQILSAVEYCHNRGIVHRDLKVKLKRERESEWFNYFNQIPGSTSIRKHLTFV